MMRPRWQKVFADIWGHKFRSLLVIASITIGLFAAGLIVSMTLIINQDMKAGYASVNPANIEVFASPFDQDLVDSVRHTAGVSQAEGVQTLTLRVLNTKGEWQPIELKAIPDIETMDINRVSVKEGIWPPQDRQVAIDIYRLGEVAKGVGSTIQVELPSGKIRELTVAAVTHDQTIGSVGAGGFFLAPVQGYITFATLEWLDSPPLMNRLYVTVQDNPTDRVHLQEIADRVTHAVETGGNVVIFSQVRPQDDHPNRVYVDAISAVLVVLGFLVLFLSGFLITNTLAALLTQQVNHIGIMKTIGARRGQIIAVYMSLIFVYGLTAFAIALPLSGWAAYALMQNFASAINIDLQGFRIEPSVVWLELGIALVIPQLAGIVPILNGTRISVVEALSGLNQNKPRETKRDRGSFRRLSRPMLLSLRNTFRRPGRLILTLTTLTLGGAIFIATFNVQSSLTKYIERIGHYFLADVTVNLNDSARISEVEQIIREVPGVRHVEGWAATAAVLVKSDGTAGESVSLLAPPAGSRLVDPVLLEGRWFQTGDDAVIVVNERFRETFPKLKLGDQIKIKIFGKEKAVSVIGFFQMAGKSGGYLAYTTYEYLSVVIHQSNRANSFRITGSQENMSLKAQKALGREIETRLKEHGFRIADVEAGRSLTATTASGLNILTGFLLMMAVLIAVVGSIGLAGTMSLNVLERTREIGIIRAIGASDRSVMELVMVEGLLIGLMSWVFGLILALPVSSLMANAIILALFGATADFTFTPIGVFLWGIVVVILSVFASVGPARNATRLTIREVLAYE
ncbi:MAG: FtsX-like permease family protein [Anaerolineales bacterium]